MPPNELKQLPSKRAIVLKNETCVYCAALLDKSSATKEHVIARHFVPKGKLQGQWNLILQACKPCNERKSDLEDDLSAISMQPDAFGAFANPDPLLAVEAVRKAQDSANRRTRKRVKDSSENQMVSMPFGANVTMTFNLVGPPQADRQRVFELSRFHVTAFFYWITYNHNRRRGGYWPGGFFPIIETVRSDWGNPVYQAFAEAVLDWTPRVLAEGADGFFKVAIRKNPSAVCWSWALEWNHKHRIIGFFGDQDSAEAIFSTFPQPEMHMLPGRPNERWRFREEVPLSEENDRLFSLGDS